MRIDNQIYLHFALFGKKCPKIPLHFLRKSAQKYRCTALFGKKCPKIPLSFALFIKKLAKIMLSVKK
jgi:hypothetical protein